MFIFLAKSWPISFILCGHDYMVKRWKLPYAVQLQARGSDLLYKTT